MIAFIIAIAVLYFARQILIPLALALLFAFLLSPVVKWLERGRIPRTAAVLVVILFAFAFLAGAGWVVTGQLLEVVNELPQYRDNIHAKMVAAQAPGPVSRLINNLEDLGKEFTTAPPTQPQAAPRTPAKSARSGASAQDGLRPPQRVEVVQPTPNALQSLRNFVGPLLGPLETGVLVLIFTIFMLIDQADLRNRILRLFGQQQLHLTTKALDDAASRVSRYLMLQFLVNAGFGTVTGLGLFLIGVPSFLLWGVLAMFLRFLPYVGPVIAGFLPFMLAVATMEGWHGPLLVFGLFLVVELLTGNAVEPLVYGPHTGLSAVALLVTAVFWTALWGPVGLILSTPLTVCLSVLGRYSPHLQFLDILLGDEPVLTPDALFYQRLLALDQREALAIIEGFLRDNPLVRLYDEVMIPALAMAEQDRHGGELEPRREEFITQSIHEFVTELAEVGPRVSRRKDRTLVPDTDVTQRQTKENRVFCLAAHDLADEITGAMFAQLTEREGYPTLAFPYTEAPVELLAGLMPQAGDVICVSSVPPIAVTHARNVGQAISEAFPEVKLVVGLWNYPATSTRTLERLQQSTGSVVATSLADALQCIRDESTDPVLSSEAVPKAIAEL